MDDRGFVYLDTKAFDEAIDMKNTLVSKYANITDEYDAIIERLKKNWKGQGAEAFFDDTRLVRTNLAQLFDVLKIMCDTLQDCKTVFMENDAALGEYNLEAAISEE
ncbi:MAG: hypothetical protein IJN77_07515 [Oscillospiraceae bacterium]|nr:hypothetical protein [Oscillospiraceae bacterium]MBQ6850868.1 hypothetical protein [Oscillospiraceae bacterium]